ncbi:hypothetical protein [Reyranella sp.]|uniref:hypothetical protein n=1 Tax=Reyranella sp. TaxID=1929291 RepID=UPI0027164C8A|nr:hypothetical protein [Reyranella sp.]MDO8973825.1 hypothetical protein [Reyranella sp.]
MPLKDLLSVTPDALSSYTIEQIVAICGDGKLRTGAESEADLRYFLSCQTGEQLALHASYCLKNAFSQSGFALQDTVNEIGRRLGFEVTNGRYSGVRNENGFDGLWTTGKTRFVVEVKTTDAYRINLDTIRDYARKLRDANVAWGDEPQVLIVVGRNDTGDLEAQVRGSRHAWNVRLISVDALLKLLFVCQRLSHTNVLDKVKRILLPFEYTKVDEIVELVFETQQETEVKVEAEAELDETESNGAASDTKYEFTPRHDLDAQRRVVVTNFFQAKNAAFHQVTRTNFASNDGAIHVTCAVSKRYPRDYQPYWYALHPKWLSFLRSAQSGYFILSCMDRVDAFAIPVSDLEALLPKLNQTKSGDKEYWHIALTTENDSLKLNLSKADERIALESYKFSSAVVAS